MIKNIVILLLLNFLTGCTTTTEILDNNLNKSTFKGIDNLLKENTSGTLKIFMIHGIGDTTKTYEIKLVKKLKKNNYTLIKTVPSKIIYSESFIINPFVKNCKKPCLITAQASIKTHIFEKEHKTLKLYSFYWNDMNSDLTEKMLKDVYLVNEYDLTDEQVALKKFIVNIFDTKFSDVMAYANQYLKQEIRKATKEGICYMHTNGDITKSSYYSLESDSHFQSVKDFNDVCKISDQNANDKYIFISVSLGSQILFDVLSNIYKENKIILENTDEFYMLANQMPLTDIMSLKLKPLRCSPKNIAPSIDYGVSGFIQSIKKEEKKGKQPKLKIISFVEPNDFLAYPMNNIDDTIEFINIKIGNSIKLLNLFVIPPDANHGIDYLENPYAVDCIIKGYKYCAEK